MRHGRFVRAFRQSLIAACVRHGFRVVHYCLQHDHCHVLIEATDPKTLACGMKSLGARLARAVNRVFAHTGPVLDGRYHHRVLGTPREVRHALAYVLLNARRHWVKAHGEAPPVVLDRASSAVWFEGWRGRSHDPPSRPRALSGARKRAVW